jgi:hypothetical protein
MAQVVDFLRYFAYFFFAAGFFAFGDGVAAGFAFATGFFSAGLAAGLAAVFGAGLVSTGAFASTVALDVWRLLVFSTVTDAGFSSTGAETGSILPFSILAASASRVFKPSCQPGVLISNRWRETEEARRQRGQNTSK